MAASPTPAPIAGAIRQTYPVLEMSCAACAVSVESMLKHTPGVVDAGVNYANQSAWVQYDPAVVTPAGLQTAVQSIGYDLVLEADIVAGQKTGHFLDQRDNRRLVGSESAGARVLDELLTRAVRTSPVADSLGDHVALTWSIEEVELEPSPGP